MSLNEKCYTPDEVATMLKVDRETVMRKLRKGEIPAFKVGRLWRISANQLLEYQQAKK